MARIIEAFAQFFDGAGEPLVDGFLKFNETGTNNTDQDTFADVSETIANDNPLQLDGEGRCPNVFGSGSYNVVSFKDSIITPGTPGEQIQQFDPVGGTLDGSAFSDWNSSTSYSIGDIVTGSDGNKYRSITNGNQDNNPTSSDENWEQLQLGRIWNANVPYTSLDSVYGPDGLLYFSLIANNLGNNPTTDATSTNWRASDQVRSANAAGTVDVITAAFIPLVGAFKNGLELRVRSSGANVSTTPTFAPDGVPAKNITKYGNQPLAPGDIGGVGSEFILVANSTNDSWELLNPIQVDIDVSRGYIDGLITSNGTDADHDIDTAVGECADSTNTVTIKLTSAITKQIDANWAEGSDMGGFPSGLTLAIDTWYHYFVIAKADGTVDSGWDTSLTAVNLLADATDYTLFRLIASNLTDASSNIIGYSQDGNDFLLDVPVVDVTLANPGTSGIPHTLTIPLGLVVYANSTFSSRDTSPTTSSSVLITSPDQTDTAASASLFDLNILVGGDDATVSVAKVVRSNLLSQVRARNDFSDAGITLIILTHGWTFFRGQN